MSRENQIKELTNELIRTNSYGTLNAVAEHLYNAGYRKQSEPISCGHEKGGEWVQLPCKVGDILYVISQMKDKRIENVLKGGE